MMNKINGQIILKLKKQEYLFLPMTQISPVKFHFATFTVQELWQLSLISLFSQTDFKFNLAKLVTTLDPYKRA